MKQVSSLCWLSIYQTLLMRKIIACCLAVLLTPYLTHNWLAWYALLNCEFWLLCSERKGPLKKKNSNKAVTEWDAEWSLTLLQLLFTNLPQLVDLRRCTGNGPLDNSRTPPQRRPCSNCVCCRQSLNLDDTNPRVFWSSIMLSVLQVAKPRFQSRRVVFTNHFTISNNIGFAGDGGPFAGGIEKGDVDLGFGLEIISFTGFGIGVEKEVDAASFLW